MRERVESQSTDRMTKDECASVGQAGFRVAPELSHQIVSAKTGKPIRQTPEMAAINAELHARPWTTE